MTPTSEVDVGGSIAGPASSTSRAPDRMAGSGEQQGLRRRWRRVGVLRVARGLGRSGELGRRRRVGGARAASAAHLGSASRARAAAPSGRALRSRPGSVPDVARRSDHRAHGQAGERRCTPSCRPRSSDRPSRRTASRPGCGRGERRSGRGSSARATSCGTECLSSCRENSMCRSDTHGTASWCDRICAAGFR